MRTLRDVIHKIITNGGSIVKHRDNGPAIIYYEILENGKEIIKKEVYYQYGELHNENGPAIIEYDDGNMLEETYYLGGVLTRDYEMHGFGPTRKTYCGEEEGESYTINNRFLRNDGPAVIARNKGKVIQCYYELEGTCLNKMQGAINGIYYTWLEKHGFFDIEKGKLKKPIITPEELMLRKIEIGF